MEAADKKEAGKRVFSDYDYSNFYYGAGEDPLNLLGPFSEWYEEALPNGYYLYSEPLSSAPSTKVQVTNRKTGQVQELLPHPDLGAVTRGFPGLRPVDDISLNASLAALPGQALEDEAHQFRQVRFEEMLNPFLGHGRIDTRLPIGAEDRIAIGLRDGVACTEDLGQVVPGPLILRSIGHEEHRIRSEVKTKILQHQKLLNGAVGSHGEIQDLVFADSRAPVVAVEMLFQQVLEGFVIADAVTLLVRGPQECYPKHARRLGLLVGPITHAPLVR